jgi:hypothetical protein
MRNFILAVILGFFAILGCNETFWQDMANQRTPEGHGPLPVIVYIIGQILSVVHAGLGTTLTVGVLALAALIFLLKALGGAARAVNR